MLGLTGDTGIGFSIQLLHCSYLIKNTSLLNGIMWVFDWFIFFLLSGFKYQLPKFNKKFGVLQSWICDQIPNSQLLKPEQLIFTS